LAAALDRPPDDALEAPVFRCLVVPPDPEVVLVGIARGDRPPDPTVVELADAGIFIRNLIN